MKSVNKKSVISIGKEHFGNPGLISPFPDLKKYINKIYSSRFLVKVQRKANNACHQITNNNIDSGLAIINDIANDFEQLSGNLFPST